MALAWLGLSEPAAALTIQLDFTPAGESITGIGTTATDAPDNVVGTGGLMDIVSAAAQVWESVILDDFTTTIHFGWAPLDGVVIARTNNTSFDNKVSAMRFDSDGSTRWYLDATPADHHEWQNVNESGSDLGGGMLNTGRYFNEPSGDAARGLDLLSTAIHEIGHSLGLSVTIGAFVNEIIDDRDIDVVSPLPFAGSVIATQGLSAELSASALPDGAMNPFAHAGRRTLVSGADALAVAQVSGWDRLTPFYLAAPQLGDLNGDDKADAFDVDGFETLLADAVAYRMDQPLLSPLARADFDNTGRVDAFDVGGFETLLAMGAGKTIPEPGCFVLAVGMGALFGQRRRAA